MDRNIVYPGAIPLDTDLLSTNRNALIAFGYLAQATLGTGTVVDGLQCEPTSPASLSVTVAPGSILAMNVVDALAYGSLAADASDPLMKMGINITGTSFSFTPPQASGQAANFLIEAAFEEADTDPVVLPYYNAANPSQPYSGPSNSGGAQNTQRVERVQLQVKSGVPANSGTQTTPPADLGWVGLYVITLSYGQTAISRSDITVFPGAPFIQFKIPQLTPGVSRLLSLTNSGEWTVPAGVSTVRVRLWGGGGGGGGGGSGAGAGGCGGGYCEGYYPVSSGQSYAISIGAGGAPGQAGGSSNFGGLCSASGGAAGGGGSGGSAGVASNTPGIGAGSGLSLSGAPGQNGLIFPGGGYTGGAGGGSFATASAFAPAGNSSTNLSGQPGNFPGGGGSGGIGSSAGGNGAPGLAIVEW